MFDLIQCPNGKNEAIYRDEHFAELVEKYMGADAAAWFNERMRGIYEHLEELSECLLSGDKESAFTIINEMQRCGE